MAELVKLSEYAILKEISLKTVKTRVHRGSFKSAVMRGKRWYLDPDEEYTDGRLNDGYYIGVHQKYYKPKENINDGDRNSGPD